MLSLCCSVPPLCRSPATRDKLCNKQLRTYTEITESRPDSYRDHRVSQSTFETASLMDLTFSTTKAFSGFRFFQQFRYPDYNLAPELTR